MQAVNDHGFTTYIFIMKKRAAFTQCRLETNKARRSKSYLQSVSFCVFERGLVTTPAVYLG